MWALAVFTFLAVLNGCSSEEGPLETQMTEHAVIVHFSYGSTNLQAIFSLEDRLEAAIAGASVGEYDGHEVAIDGSDGYLYMYGPDADRLFDIVRPILESAPFTRGATVTVRYGPPDEGIRQKQIKLGP